MTASALAIVLSLHVTPCEVNGLKDVEFQRKTFLCHVLHTEFSVMLMLYHIWCIFRFGQLYLFRFVRVVFVQICESCICSDL